MCNLALIVIILVILWLIYMLHPGIVPEKFWTFKSWRAFDRFTNRVKEKMVPYTDPDVVPGKIISYYKRFTKEKYGENAIVVGLHYTNWCGYCKRMKPIWAAVKKSIMEDPKHKYTGVLMIENDEQTNPTPGVNEYPMIIKYRGGKASSFKGLADFHQLREWVLSTSILDSSGAAW